VLRSCDAGKTETVLTMATLAARNPNEVMMVPEVGSSGICVWREYGIRRLICVGAFVRNVASFAVKMYSTFNLF
jgi:hypothetical protein